MGIPNPGLGKLFHPVAAVGGLAFGAYLNQREYIQRTRAGENKLKVGLSETLSLALQSTLSWKGQLALSLGPLIARAAASTLATQVVQRTHQHNTFTRLAKTPFSHRFEHSDATSMAQMNGLSALGQSWGSAQLGTEAAQMAKRYGR